MHILFQSYCKEHDEAIDTAFTKFVVLFEALKSQGLEIISKDKQ